MASAAKKVRVLRTPADSVEDLLERQRAQRDKMKELQRRHEAEKESLRRRQEAEMEGARHEEEELKRREAEARARTSKHVVHGARTGLEGSLRLTVGYSVAHRWLPCLCRLQGVSGGCLDYWFALARPFWAVFWVSRVVCRMFCVVFTVFGILFAVFR